MIKGFDMADCVLAGQPVVHKQTFHTATLDHFEPETLFESINDLPDWDDASKTRNIEWLAERLEGGSVNLEDWIAAFPQDHAKIMGLMQWLDKW